jgi:hypothetical protein
MHSVDQTRLGKGSAQAAGGTKRRGLSGLRRSHRRGSDSRNSQENVSHVILLQTGDDDARGDDSL